MSSLDRIPLKERQPILFLGRGKVSVEHGSFVYQPGDGEVTHVPVGGVACIMLEPGTRISHKAVVMASRVGCLLVWVGDAGVRMYSSGKPGNAQGEHLLYQARLANQPRARLEVVREIYRQRFGEEPPSRRSIDQIRGIEGAKVKERYRELANKHDIHWNGRNYGWDEWGKVDRPNLCISAAAACLNGLVEAALLLSGYSPAIGFLHRGDRRSFVFDIADIFKFDTVVPAAFEVAAEEPQHPERAVRHVVRDKFRETQFMKRLIPTIQEVLEAGEPFISEDESWNEEWWRGKSDWSPPEQL
jgi:CRISPR-associated protein Cas1